MEQATGETGGTAVPSGDNQSHVQTLESSTAIITFTGGATGNSSECSSESEEEPAVAVAKLHPSPGNAQFQSLHKDNGINDSVVNNNKAVQNGLPSEPTVRTDTDGGRYVGSGHGDTGPQSADPRSDVSEAEPTNCQRTPRFNPFDHDIHVEEDHFKHSENTSDASRLGEKEACLSDASRLGEKEACLSDASRLDDSDDSISDLASSPLSKEFIMNDIVTNAELGLAENHFAQPEGPFGLSTIEELQMAIQNCKDFILEAPESSDRRKNLVNKLIQFRLQLQEAKEGPVEPENDVKVVVGHRFMKKASKSSKHYCEKCTSVIWGAFQTWYKCLACGFCCHDKCLNLIYRTCASVKVSENPHYILSICPSKGISCQNYRCAECRTPISYVSGYEEPRQCDYTGSFYCCGCHWNDAMVVPARILHNWDLEPRKVCRASKQFLRLMSHRACLRIQDVNPMLFSFVEELNEVKKLREEILIMKKYFLSCQDALNSKLLLQLQDRQHFVDNSDMYSVDDLLDVAYDRLLPELAKIHSSFAQHIKTDCQRCRAKGYVCELCDVQEVLFPFDNIAIVCDHCSTVLHRHCFVRRNRTCPKCERLSRRAAIEGTPSVEQT